MSGKSPYRFAIQITIKCGQYCSYLHRNSYRVVLGNSKAILASYHDTITTLFQAPFQRCGDNLRTVSTEIDTYIASIILFVCIYKEHMHVYINCCRHFYCVARFRGSGNSRCGEILRKYGTRNGTWHCTFTQNVYEYTPALSFSMPFCAHITNLGSERNLMIMITHGIISHQTRNKINICVKTLQ